ncbi:meiosis-specific kinetochore protein isoform X2 [Symphalangus syndactylus]|uniref:meiosis-specific kinetochore protein isoform X2 n=1 Tax=Symphalangus syndactylus TaxID=9590 RepID=UPI0024422AB5|nr:meiosis-specific kinetochore protein isoform X2 [Symphalangus syndactylus]
MWPLRVYTRKKREGQRLNLTPTPDLGSPAKAEAPPGSKRKGKAHGLSKIAEKAERSRQGGSGSGPPSHRLGVTGEKSLQENRFSEDPQHEKIAPLSESVTDDLQVDSSSSNSELVSGLSWHHGMASSPLSYSVTDSYAEYKSFEESFPSPELLRKSDYLDWECPNLEEHMQWKNSTLLDTSKAVAIEKAPQFSNVSAILSTSSEDYQKCHRKTVMTVADQNVSPKASNSESDNAACEILLAEKTCPSTPEKTKKKKTNSSTPGKKNRGLLTSTPSSETAGFVFPANASEICCIIRTSPRTRQVKNKRVIEKKKKYSLPKDIPQDIIIKMA